MMQMNQLLSELYNTNGVKTAAATQGDAAQQEKLALAAQVQLFTKMAADGALGTDQQGHGFDVGALVEAGHTQLVDQLWANFHDHLNKTAAQQEFERRKQAEFPPPKKDGEGDKDGDKGEKNDKGDGDKKDLEEKAKKEHEEKQASLQKIAEADFRGRVMAHALAQEIGLIASGSPEINKTAAAAVEQIYRTAGALNGAGNDKVASYLGGSESGNLVRGAGGALAAGAGHKIRNAAHAIGQHLKDHGKTYAAGAGGAAVGAAAHHAASKKDDDKKEASAIDRLAVDVAIQKVANWVFEAAKQQGVAEPQAVQLATNEAASAADKIAAADTLGKYDGESVKVAAAPDWQTAVDWRACELLEGAGYQITWPS